MARQALHTAIDRDYQDAILYFDEQLQATFGEIMQHVPSNEKNKRELFSFLIDCCRESDFEEKTAKQAKSKMLSLI